MADVLQLEVEVAQAIAREIQIQLTPEETRRFRNTKRVISSAQEKYWIGRSLPWRGNIADRKQSTALFAEAIQIQPDHAAAHASLSIAWRLLEASMTQAPGEGRGIARQEALK